jgi:hypothetical protein
MSFKDRFHTKVWPKILCFLIVSPLTALAYCFFGVEGATTFIALLAYGCVALVTYGMGRVLWLEWQTKAQTVQWKQRIQQISDCTDSPYEEYSFDDFCEFTDDLELERTIEFLKQMPKGQRNVNEAYAKVLAKYGGTN